MLQMWYKDKISIHSTISEAFQNLLQLLSCLNPLDFFLTNSPSGMYSTAVSSSLLSSLDSSILSIGLIISSFASLSLSCPVRPSVFSDILIAAFRRASSSTDCFQSLNDSSSYSESSSLYL